MGRFLHVVPFLGGRKPQPAVLEAHEGCITFSTATSAGVHDHVQSSFGGRTPTISVSQSVFVPQMLHHLPGGLVAYGSSLMAAMVGRSAENGFQDAYGRRLTRELSEDERACVSSPRGAELHKQAMVLTMAEDGKTVRESFSTPE